MSLALKIDDQIKEAMKAKDADRLSVLRMLKSAMKYAVIEKYGAEGVAKDEDVLAAVRKEIKKRQDSIEAFDKGGRPEQAAKEKAEMKILEAYLPADWTKERAVHLCRGSFSDDSGCYGREDGLRAEV